MRKNKNSTFSQTHNYNQQMTASTIQDPQKQFIKSSKLLQLFSNPSSWENRPKNRHELQLSGNVTIRGHAKQQNQPSNIFSSRNSSKNRKQDLLKRHCLPQINQFLKEDLINFKSYQTYKKNQRLKRKKMYQPISLFLQGQKKQRKQGNQVSQKHDQKCSSSLFQSEIEKKSETIQKNSKHTIIPINNPEARQNQANHINLKNFILKQLSKRDTMTKTRVQQKDANNNRRGPNNSTSFRTVEMELSQKLQSMQKLQRIQGSFKSIKFNPVNHDIHKFNSIQHKMSCESSLNRQQQGNIQEFSFQFFSVQQINSKSNKNHKGKTKIKGEAESLDYQSRKNVQTSHNKNKFMKKQVKLIQQKNNLYKNPQILNNQDNYRSKNHIKGHNIKTIANKKLQNLVYLTQKQLKKVKCQCFLVVKVDQINTKSLKQKNEGLHNNRQDNDQQYYKIIASNYSKKVAQIASLTKIMTFFACITIGKLYKIPFHQAIVKIDQYAQQMTGTSAQILSGDLFTVEQLFYGLMLPSGNDAAVALATWGATTLIQNSHPIVNSISNSNSQNPSQGLLRIFILFMNSISKNIGMKSSIFANPHGLPNSNNVSNAQDLALLVSKCIKQQIFLKVIGTKSYSIWVTNQKQQNAKRRQIIWQNTQKLLRRQNFLGGKTGVTVTAGPCLTTIYKHPTTKQTFIVVVLRAHKLSRRFKQTRLILGWTLQKLDGQKYSQQAIKILKHDKILDSDNSSDQQQFDFRRNDSEQMEKRIKILQFQM